MNLQQQSLKMSLHIPPSKWQQFRQAMLDARQDREEVIGFLFCLRQQLSKGKLRYIPVSWIVPTPDCYEHQSETGLVLKQSFHQYILDTYLGDDQAGKLDVVHVHTHFGNATPSFSVIDDRHEAEYARFLASSYPHKPRLISGVFNESLEEFKFRIWDRKGINRTPIEFYNSWFAPQSDRVIAPDTTAEMFTRQQVFGNVVQQQLGQLKVALIGCGGIGAVFAEQLARLGVKHWLLIDPDRLETVNLNRMPGATQEMVDQWWHKVHYVKWLIKRAYTKGRGVATCGRPFSRPFGSHVRALPISVEDSPARAEIAAADLIVVATDNHQSRQVAQELALKYARPLVCLGTHIEVKPNSQPRMYCRVTVPPLGGGWCLMCGNIINLQQAALESAPSEIMDIAEEAGYLPGIDDPAVYWLNSICASTGVGVIHGILAGFLNVDAGLDWIYDFSNSNWLKTNTEHLHTHDCYFCSADIDSAIADDEQDFKSPEDYWFHNDSNKNNEEIFPKTTII
jgi:hypothetical protein